MTVSKEKNEIFILLVPNSRLYMERKQLSNKYQNYNFPGFIIGNYLQNQR